jgi:MFS family permease
VPEPLVDLGTFARRGMAASNATTILVGFSMTAFFVVLPAFLQVPAELGYGFGASPIETGLFFLPCSAAMVVAGPAAGALGGRFGFVAPLRAGLSMSASALALLAYAHDARWMPFAWLALLGTGVAISLAAIGTIVVQQAPVRETSVASGVNLIMRTIGGAIGAQVAAAVLASNTAAGAPVPLERGFTTAFALAAAAAVLALLPTLLLTARPGRRVPRRAALPDPA